jgi:superfamily II DNA helicase RecQ
LKEVVLKAIQNPNEKNLLNLLLMVFGLSYFHKGQMATIERVFGFQNTMLNLPTGSGKSFC